MIQLVTIDCWDTLLRNTAAWDPVLISTASKIFLTTDSAVTEAMTAVAFCEEDAAFSKTLTEKMITILVEDRLRSLARHVGVKLREESLNELRSAFDDTILNPLPELVPGADEFLARVKGANVRLCLISNTGWFSSRAISRALKRHNLIRFFDFLIYSDEVGSAKPSAKLFNVALAATNSRPREAVHIGDKLTTDVAGALNAGLHAVHFHPDGACPSGKNWCASDYAAVWTILSGQLGLTAVK